MTTIGFIGLGVMGLPMATNLASAGFDVLGHNRSPHRVDQFVANGGKAAHSIGDAVTDADVVITMLPDTPDVEAILTGGDGVFSLARPGTLVIDMSTIQPGAARRFQELGAERGLDVLDAPVSGGEQGAIEGALSIMVGGDDSAFQRAKPVFEQLGTTIVHVGAAGSGQTVKAANQLLVAGIIELVAEAMVYLRAHGVDRSRAIEVLAGGLAGNRVLDRKGASMLARDFRPGFRVDLHHKDLSIVLESARAAGIALPLGGLTATLMGSLRAQGHGGLDHSALLLQAEQMSGFANDAELQVSQQS